MQMWLEPYLKETPPKVAAWNGKVTQKIGSKVTSKEGFPEAQGLKSPKEALGAPHCN